MVAASPRSVKEEARIPLNELRQRDHAQGFRDGQLAERTEYATLCWSEETGQTFKALSQTEAAS